MRLMLVLGIVLFVCLLLLLLIADRGVKAVRRGRRRRDVNERLAAVAARAEAKETKRRAATEAREALTSVMPTIHDHETRRVELRRVRVVVLSDTHAPRRWRTCPPAVAATLRGADLILHAGDVCTAAVLDELAQYAPVTAVIGNNDDATVAAWGAGETVSLVVDGLRVAMIHDSGPSAGRPARLRRRFPSCDLVVFGHSHIPLDFSADGFRIFNPGSPTDRRRQPHGTIGLLTVADGQLLSATIVPVTLALPGYRATSAARPQARVTAQLMSGQIRLLDVLLLSVCLFPY